MQFPDVTMMCEGRACSQMVGTFASPNQGQAANSKSMQASGADVLQRMCRSAVTHPVSAVDFWSLNQ